MAGETQPGVGTVGARLRPAREVRRLSVHAIATTTKIPVGALDALEENDVARLPGGIFLRGFVRSYAAAVGLNPEQTVRDFVAQLPAHESAFDAPILGPAGRSPQEAAHDLPTRCPGPGRHDPRAAQMTPASERFQSLATANRLFTATTKTAPPRKSTRFAMIRVTTSPM